MNPQIEHHDVVVVGARCAGAATSMLLASLGHDVVVLDRTVMPSDTLSTHALARSGVVQLSRWGLLDRLLAVGTPAVRQAVFHGEDGRVVRTIKERAGVDLLVAPRRTVLDPLLVDAAVQAGADVRMGVTVQGVTMDDGGRVTGVRAVRDGVEIELRARLVIGADGLRSRVARSVGAPLYFAGPSASAAHYTYVTGEWTAMEYYQGDGAFAGIFPTNDGQACIWVCQVADDAEAIRRAHPDLLGAFHTMLEHASPELHERVRQGVMTSAPRGMLRLPNQLRQSFGPGWALVGDAGYHRDAVTGHGISDAFRDAELLARSVDGILRGDDESAALQQYQDTRDCLLADLFRITIELSQYPERERFVELQRELSQAIEEQSNTLAAWPSFRPAVAAA